MLSAREMAALRLRGCCLAAGAGGSDKINNNGDHRRQALRASSPRRRLRDPDSWRRPSLTADLEGGKGYNRNLDHNLLSLLLFFHSGSGSSMVAIDNKIEQAMDLVKSHLMYAGREEVELLKAQIKELLDLNGLLEQENALLKSLADPDQLAQLPPPARAPPLHPPTPPSSSATPPSTPSSPSPPTSSTT
ncbi:TSC22 domain family protein 1-like [Leucoraja erinacea]|uniref:TSC22 domain family protein 1-like n=1 Tax=Leucoraja erinaceus TaxID=7782 RepID=UPI002458FBDD|nr:TSC22 domain family protein 1-like [Leucoraja erinacea]